MDDFSIQIEKASGYQALKSARQIMFQLTKIDPTFEPIFRDADGVYLQMCAALRVEPERIFDIYEYEKSQH